MVVGRGLKGGGWREFKEVPDVGDGEVAAVGDEFEFGGGGGEGGFVGGDLVGLGRSGGVVVAVEDVVLLLQKG